MDYLIIVIFLIGYLLITLEHILKLDKVVIALIMASLTWGIIAYFNMEVFETKNGLVSVSKKLMQDYFFINQSKLLGINIDSNYFYIQSILIVLGSHLKEIAEILFFLIGAMTIVEIIELNKGFVVIKKIINITNKRKLLWFISVFSFILSAIIDNLTATIVIITMLKKIIVNPRERLWYIGSIIIAANAGGAWSPIGDVTTTMLWISHKVTVKKLIEYVLIPSIICMIIPIWILQFNKVFKDTIVYKDDDNDFQYKSSTIILCLGIIMIIFVPIFKIVTGLPPYVGMIFSLGVLVLVSESFKLSNLKQGLKDLNNINHMSFQEKLIKKQCFVQDLRLVSIHKALSKIEMSSILFFLGILMGIASLESLGILFNFANLLKQKFSSECMVIFLGIISAIIDNVPLVAASLSMFLDPMDANIWHFIAFSCGTGGSALIIGSSSGIAAMGMEKISFIWYLKNISWLALIGFFSGSLLFILFRN